VTKNSQYLKIKRRRRLSGLKQGLNLVKNCNF